MLGSAGEPDSGRKAHPGLELDPPARKIRVPDCRRHLRCDVQKDRLADAGLADHQQSCALSPGCGKERRTRSISVSRRTQLTGLVRLAVPRSLATNETGHCERAFTSGM